MKIALIGAHGTGKTTLAKAIKEAFGRRIDCCISPEVPRVVCEILGDAEYFRRQNNTLAKQLAILVGQLAIESDLARSPGRLIISDRSILDHWAYTTVLFEQELDESRLREPLQSFVEMHLANYDRLFYVPIEFAPLDDGTRESDVAFQREIAAKLESEIHRLQLSCVQLSGGVGARVNQVTQALPELG